MKKTTENPLEDLARTLNGDPEHAFQVRRLAATLFDATAVLHGLGGASKRLLEAAALLHDIGLCRGAAEHHKHSRDMILKLELPGFSPAELQMIACIARYHRKGHPVPNHKVFQDLDPAQQKSVTLLSALLRVADGLDRSHQSSARELRVRIDPETVSIGVVQQPESYLDLWGARRKAKLMEDVLGRTMGIAGEV